MATMSALVLGNFSYFESVLCLASLIVMELFLATPADVESAASSPVMQAKEGSSSHIPTISPPRPGNKSPHRGARCCRCLYHNRPPSAPQVCFLSAYPHPLPPTLSPVVGSGGGGGAACGDCSGPWRHRLTVGFRRSLGPARSWPGPRRPTPADRPLVREAPEAPSAGEKSEPARGRRCVGGRDRRRSRTEPALGSEALLHPPAHRNPPRFRGRRAEGAAGVEFTRPARARGGRPRGEKGGRGPAEAAPRRSSPRRRRACWRRATREAVQVRAEELWKRLQRSCGNACREAVETLAEKL